MGETSATPMKNTIRSLLVAVGLIGSGSGKDTNPPTNPGGNGGNGGRGGLFSGNGDLANGLVSFYSFNGNYNDSVGGNNFTSITSGASFTTDRFGNPNSAVTLSSYSDSIATQNNLNLTTGSPFTISIWCKPSSTAVCWDGVNAIGGSLVQFGQLNADMSNYGGWLDMLFLTKERGGLINFDGGYSQIEHSDAFAQLFDQWHQIVYTYDNSISNSKIYIDGNQVSTTSAGYTDVRNIVNTPLSVGNYVYSLNGNTSGGIANSPFSDLGIWNTALSSSQVSSLYTLQTAPEPSTFALFGIGAIGLLMVMRRKKTA